MRIIKRNAIRCKKCGDIIESKSVHDFQMCSCQSSFVDGGHEYIRVGGYPDDVEFLSEYEDVPGFHVAYLHKGFSWTTPYESDFPESLNDILWRFPESQYYLKITDEDGNVTYVVNGTKIAVELVVIPRWISISL